MRFLIDAQLPPVLRSLFQEAGHAAEHVYELSLAEADDETVWREAGRREAILVTKDEDFSNPLMIKRSKTSVIWIRFGNASNRTLIQRIKPLLPDIIERLRQGERLIELV